MQRNDLKKSQGGFTLIEIIAVLVILGILAAVAIPRFLDLQSDAQQKALDGACAAVGSNVSLAFSKALLNNNSTSEAIDYATSGAGFITNLGDFTATQPSSPGTSNQNFTVAVSFNSDTSVTKNCNIANPAAP